MSPQFDQIPPPNWATTRPRDEYRWYYRVTEILNGIVKTLWRNVDTTGSALTDIETRPHSDLQDILQADDTSNSSTTGKHVTDAQVKTYGDHVRITAANPHGTDHSQLDAILGTGEYHIKATEASEIAGIDAVTTGLLAKTADATYAVRTITGTSGEVEVSNGDGVSANPTIGLPTLISAPRQFGTVTDNLEVEATGFQKFTGSAKYWRDIDFPIIIRTVAANFPTLTTVNGNLIMPQWAVNDFVMTESQELVHEWEEASRVYFHIHMTTNGLDATERFVRFEVEYGYATPSGQWVFPATINSGDVSIPANTPDKTMLIVPIGNFVPTAVTVAGHVIARLKRIAATGTAPSNNPWVPILQLHILCDTPGSRTMTAK